MSHYYKEETLRDRSRFDRYRECKKLTDLETNEVLLSTRERLDIRVDPRDQIHTVSHEDMGRLDIISNIYYRTPLLWWIIAESNDIYDAFQPVTVGTMLRIPSLETLYGNNGVLL